jgi:hypothetical protein
MCKTERGQVAGYATARRTKMPLSSMAMTHRQSYGRLLQGGQSRDGEKTSRLPPFSWIPKVEKKERILSNTGNVGQSLLE